MPNEWTSEDRYKVQQVLEVLQGNDITLTEKMSESSSDDDLSTVEAEDENIFGEEPDDAGDFFEIDES